MYFCIPWGILANVKISHLSAFSLWLCDLFPSCCALRQRTRGINHITPRFRPITLTYTTLKSVISSFKICFQNYGQLKRKFLRPKITSSNFLKFELASLSGTMLKTRKNTIRNQFEQRWFDVFSFHKPGRAYPAIWNNLKTFANMEKADLSCQLL